MKERGIRAGINRLMRLPLHGSRAAAVDADDELRAFLESRVEALVAAGMTPDQAHAEALRRLGSNDVVRQSAVRRERRLDLRERLAELAFDLRYATRALARRPGYTAAMVITLALGMGAATGVFSIVNGVLLRSLPYPDPHELTRIYETTQTGELRSIAIPTLGDWRRTIRSFDAIALYGPTSFDYSDASRAEKIEGANASAALFSILGVRPMLGRAFLASEDKPGSASVVLLSHRTWLRIFNGDSSVVGRTITIDRQPVTVVGVMPPGFAYPVGAEIWSPIGADAEYDARAARHMAAIGRLRDGVTLEQATRELLQQERELAKVYPAIYEGRGIRLIPLDERIVGDVRPAILMLGGAVLLVLVVACANVANLLLARAASRQRELAVRTALGGSRGRIARQVFMESIVVFTVAGAVGIALALALVQIARGLPPDVLPRASEIDVDGTVLLFAALSSGLTAALFGLLPAIQAARTAPGEALTDGSRGSTSGRRKGRARASLIVAEAAIAALLLVGAGLLVRSLQQLNRVDPGFPADKIATFNVSAPSAMTSDRHATVEFFRVLRERLASMPGVAGVGMASRLPLSGEDHSNGFRLPSDPAGQLSDRSAQDRAVTPGYFKAMGISVVAGREFTESDGATSAPVVMVNRAFADRYFPGVDPIGQRFTPSRADGLSRQVVGVVADTRQFGLDEAALPEFYIVHAQDPWPFLNVAVRAEGSAASVLPAIRQVIREIDPQLPVGNVRTIASVAADAGARRRLIATILGAFGVAAYLLAAVGLYGVISYAVAEETPSLGIRMALGAQRSRIARMVLMRAMGLAGIGVAIGLAASVPLTRFLRGMLYGVGEGDPITYVGVAILLPLVAVVASALPARRAMRIDPARAMRAE
jgi:putative ABC transport system permease protein